MSAPAPTYVVVNRDSPTPPPPILAVTVRQPGWGLTVGKSCAGTYTLSFEPGGQVHIEPVDFHDFIAAVSEFVNQED